MKGVIMAGGKGTRLKPLTCNIPKPMVPLIHKPVMEYSIELLKKHGITEIAVTLQYLPDCIKNYFGNGEQFGVNLHYFEETTPLGTAGSIKNAQEFLDERFIVISGDALTDFDLSAGIRFHEEKKGLVTIFMKQVDTPLEYGVLMTNEQDEIVRFLEKPSWNEVFSDTVNTGIYILEPEVFNYLEKDIEIDFSKDLFPLLMKEKRPLFGYNAKGYWSDVGNLNQYRQTQYDMLDGIVHVNLPGTEVEPGIWIGKRTVIENGAKLIPPVSVDEGVVVRSGAIVDQYSIIGRNNIISSKASIKKSVLWNDVYVGDHSELRGTTICNGTHLSQNISLFEHSVIGDHCFIDRNVMVKPEVKVWPNKRINEDVTVHSSLIWGRKFTKSLFNGHYVSGLANVEITPDYISRLASAYGAILPHGTTIMLSSDHHEFTSLIKKSFVQGLHGAGINSVDLGHTIAPVLRFTIETGPTEGGVHFHLSNRNNEKQMKIAFFDHLGLPINDECQRKIESAYWQEDYRRAAFDYIGKGNSNEQLINKYTQQLLETVRMSSIRNSNLRVVVDFNHRSDLSLILSILDELNCEIFTMPYHKDASEAARYVQAVHAHIGIRINETGEKVTLITEQGEIVEDPTLMALYVFIHFYKGKNKRMAVPTHTSSELDLIAQRLNGQLIRTKANARAVMEVGGGVLNLQHDAQYAVVHLLELMAIQEDSLSKMIKLLPEIHLLRESVPCPRRVKGQVMRLLMQDSSQKNIELLDGIKVNHPEGGWTLILPDNDKPVFTVYAQANDFASAKQIASNYVNKIRKYQKG